MSSKPCTFFIGDSKKGLSYDEMRAHLIENYDSMVEGGARVSKQESIEQNKKEKVDSDLDKKIKSVGKPDVSLPVLSNKELVDSKDPVVNKSQNESIRKRQIELEKLINCLWA